MGKKDVPLDKSGKNDNKGRKEAEEINEEELNLKKQEEVSPDQSGKKEKKRKREVKLKEKELNLKKQEEVSPDQSRKKEKTRKKEADKSGNKGLLSILRCRDAEVEEKKLNLKKQVVSPDKSDKKRKKEAEEKELNLKKQKVSPNKSENKGKKSWFSRFSLLKRQEAEMEKQKDDDSSDEDAPVKIVSQTKKAPAPAAAKKKEGSSDDSPEEDAKPAKPAAKLAAKKDHVKPAALKKAPAPVIHHDYSCNDKPGGRLKTLYAGNLSSYIDKPDVIHFFKQAGKIADVRFSFDEDENFQGCGHVEFVTEKDAKKAVKLNGLDLLACPVELDFAREGQTICIRGFDPSSEIDQIRSYLEKHFSTCGQITRVSIPKNHDTGAARGIAYIEFGDADAFGEALAMNGAEFGGSSLTVEEARPRDRDGGASGGRGGGRGGGTFSGDRSAYTQQSGYCNFSYLSGDRSAYTQQSGVEKPEGRTIYIRGFDTSSGIYQIQSSLERYFSTCGQIRRVSVPKNHTGAARGIAYIEFGDADAFGKALAMNGAEFGGSSLTVEEARPRGHDGGASGGRGGGRRGGRFSGGRGGRDGGRSGGRGGRGSTPFSGKKTTFDD